MNNIITDAEWEVMKIVWEKSRVPSNEIVRVLKSTMNWQDSTIYTLISRLVKKKMIAIEKESSPYMCYPLILQKDYRKKERKSFLKKMYDGSLNLMLANMIEDKEISEQDIDELKKILDSSREDRRKE